MSVLIIDNYDSFVFNLERSVREAGFETIVRRNDAIDIEGINALSPSAIIISPGPCGPDEAGVSCPAISAFSGRIPILGVCLGHQCVGRVFGLEVSPSGTPVYGHEENIFHEESVLFEGLGSPFPAARYHALVVSEPPRGHALKVTARTGEGLIMALEHESHLTFGVQFHPESILTHAGDNIIRKFLRLATREVA